MKRTLEAISAKDQIEELDRSHYELMRTVFEEQSRSKGRTRALALEGQAGTAAKLGVKRQPWLAAIRRSLDKTSVRSRNRTCHCRRRNEPEAGGPRRVVTTASAKICSFDGSPGNWPSLR